MSRMLLRTGMMRTMVVAAVIALGPGCASKACIVLLEQAEAQYRVAMREAEREVPPDKSEGKWKTVLSSFGQAQSLADESQRKYVALKREDPDKNEQLRKELEQANYFQRFSTVYACSQRMQGLALSRLGSDVYADQKKKAGDLVAKEAEERYKYKIECGYGGK